MRITLVLTKRNIKLFYNDKGMFFTSLITPVILLVLYVTFLGKTYRDVFVSSLTGALPFPEDIAEGLVGGHLISSILSVSCVTVAFCSNFVMVQDKANGTIRDLTIAPVKKAILSLSYYMATFVSALLICMLATAICLVYVAWVGWYLSMTDVFLLFFDVLLLVLFGTALSSIICHFLSTQGQISAVSTVVSAGYGFICGAYMPISSFGEGLQKALSFLPGTYGTALIRNHTMRGALNQMQSQGVPEGIVAELKEFLDCNPNFLDRQVKISGMYVILGTTIALLVVVYVGLNRFKGRGGFRQ